MSELKLCPFCKNKARKDEPIKYPDECGCSNPDCYLYMAQVEKKEWNSRPIEDASKLRMVGLRKLLLIADRELMDDPSHKCERIHGLIEKELEKSTDFGPLEEDSGPIVGELANFTDREGRN